MTTQIQNAYQLQSECRDADCAGIDTTSQECPFIILYIVDEKSNYDTKLSEWVDDKSNYEGYIKIGATDVLENLSESSDIRNWVECSDLIDIKLMLGLSNSNHPLRYGKIVFLCDDKLKKNIMYWIKKRYPSFNLPVE